ncbi:MAG: hypothetical protein KA742_09250, partial [Pseudoxanthomonas sp.]|nr:hypothetical protein [Pseudoxanthomonas sp.]
FEWCEFTPASAPPSAPVGVEGLMQLAREWCLSWGEWAHDADPGCAKESAAEAALRAALTQALARQPAACPRCKGTGEADSGGIMPWGAPATIPCDCQQPAAVTQSDSGAVSNASAPVGVAGDTVGLHVLTGVFDKHGEELRAGDRIVTRLEGEHTKPEYWNPEYVIAWAAPRFTLRHVGGGLDSDTARWYFGLGTEQGYRMLELLDRPAALAQQPAPVAPVGVAYLDIGVGGYMDLGTEMSDEELAKLPNGRHVLGIIGTHGVDGYTLAQQPAAVDGECVDWRAMYRFQTAMRYMDNNPNLSKQKADRMADDDVAGLESANATQPGGSDNDQ